MDAKTRDVALLAALSLFCAGFAWSWGYVILGSVFFVLAVVAALGIAQKYWRWHVPWGNCVWCEELRTNRT
jgi:hypothetical protein